MVLILAALHQSTSYANHFAHVQSFLMDRLTVLALEVLCGEDATPTQRDLPRLNASESALYDDLRDNRLRSNLRLELERIGFGWVEHAVSTLLLPKDHRSESRADRRS